VLSEELSHEDLLVPVVRDGRAVGGRPSLAEIRQRAQRQLAALDPSVRRLMKPHSYPVGLTEDLYQQRLRLIALGRAGQSGSAPASTPSAPGAGRT
jgi:nicotinate phosphoribosyltransferase